MPSKSSSFITHFYNIEFNAGSMLLVVPATMFAAWLFYFSSSEGTDAWAIQQNSENSFEQATDLTDAGYVPRMVNWTTTNQSLGPVLAAGVAASCGDSGGTPSLSVETETSLSSILDRLHVRPMILTLTILSFTVSVSGSRYLG